MTLQGEDGPRTVKRLHALQAGRREHNESYAYYTNISRLNMTSPYGKSDDLRSVSEPLSPDQCQESTISSVNTCHKVTFTSGLCASCQQTSRGCTTALFSGGDYLLSNFGTGQQ